MTAGVAPYRTPARRDPLTCVFVCVFDCGSTGPRPGRCAMLRFLSER
jgi:hypothetical protein